MKRKLAIGSIAAGAALATATLLWVGADGLHTVIPGELYRSGQPYPDQIEAIVTRLDIKTIVNLRGAGADRTEAVHAIADHLHVKQYDINLLSRELPYITELLKLIEVLKNAERPILVHCLSGVDRAGLASAVALLMRNDFGLQDAKWQTSVRYGVINTQSIGKQFLVQYEAWLSVIGQEHAPERFLEWATDNYVDGMGNLWFYLDSINSMTVSRSDSKRLRDGYVFELDGNDFRANGWAFDLRNRRLLKDVTVVLNNRSLTQTRYGRTRPDVADFFHIPEVIAAGWSVNANLSGWPRRCYDMRLRLTRLDGSVWQSSPQAKVCMR
jgi:undecaprenyl-diphosphatase